MSYKNQSIKKHTVGGRLLLLRAITQLIDREGVILGIEKKSQGFQAHWSKNIRQSQSSNQAALFSLRPHFRTFCESIYRFKIDQAGLCQGQMFKWAALCQVRQLISMTRSS
ncbi:hypothetical protein FGO68_gene3526 [Halteria grandinella]|uniref:Uncharacterized protein n=1 Tax=Halteria grandinella TaxID=5974 RepID=A0A8J8P317_HALGN|nr:hypothetical protein FGO68_gene3526 [Halteria grandinella]